MLHHDGVCFGFGACPVFKHRQGTHFQQQIFRITLLLSICDLFCVYYCFCCNVNKRQIKPNLLFMSFPQSRNAVWALARLLMQNKLFWQYTSHNKLSWKIRITKSMVIKKRHIYFNSLTTISYTIVQPCLVCKIRCFGRRWTRTLRLCAVGNQKYIHGHGCLNILCIWVISASGYEQTDSVHGGGERFGIWTLTFKVKLQTFRLRKLSVDTNSKSVFCWFSSFTVCSWHCLIISSVHVLKARVAYWFMLMV